MVIIFFLLQYTSKLEKKISHSENEKFKTAYCLTVKLLAYLSVLLHKRKAFLINSVISNYLTKMKVFV